MSRIIPFTYHGSKSNSFEFINTHLPRSRQYIEPFGGAGTILLNRDPVPVETYNDLHDDIPHFFQVLRDEPDELLRVLERTPFSREEHRRACSLRDEGYPDCSDVERARLFFVTVQQSRSHRPDEGNSSWRYSVSFTKGRSIDGSTSVMKTRVDDYLRTIAGRLRDVQVESKPAIDVIETHDRETATFYVDPPYVSESRGSDDNYRLEMTEADHRELFEVLDSCEGYVAVSGYGSELYESLYSDWYCFAEDEKGAGEGDGTRQELLWTNYDAEEIGGEKIGDWPMPRRKGQQLTLTDATHQPK